MKKFTCYDCEEFFESETSKEMLGELYSHYMKEHKEIITGNTEEEKKVWMERFSKDWRNTKDETE